MGTATGAASKKEKGPKDGKDNTKGEQEERVHPGWAPLVVLEALLSPTVLFPFPWHQVGGREMGKYGGNDTDSKGKGSGFLWS